MSEQEDHLRRDMTGALGALARAAQHAAELIAAYVPEPPQPTPVKADQRRFEHTDEDGDRLTVTSQSTESPEWHIFRARGEVTEEGVAVRLRSDELNKLAQYLDRYRTDVPCPGKPGELRFEDQCAGTQHHGGPCSSDADMTGSLVTYPLPTGFDRCTGTYEGFWCRRLTGHEGGHA